VENLQDILPVSQYGAPAYRPGDKETNRAIDNDSGTLSAAAFRPTRQTVRPLNRQRNIIYGPHALIPFAKIEL